MIVVLLVDGLIPPQNKFGQSIFIFSNDAVEGLQELAEANKNKIAFTIVDDSQERLLEYLGVDADDYPAVIISVRPWTCTPCLSDVTPGDPWQREVPSRGRGEREEHQGLPEQVLRQEA
jgi:hypothetical protein